MKKQAPKKIKATANEPFWKKHTALLLALFAFLLYANTIGNGYNMDDELVTQKHKLTSKGIKAIPEIFKSPYYSDDMGYAYEYRPTVLSSFAIEKSLIGESAGKSHFVNVLLYALLIYLIYIVLQNLLQTYSFWLPLISTLLFAAHPLHTEVVASIKNRDEILALMGAFGAWLIFLRYIETQKHWLLLPAVGVFILGLLSKISIAPLAFLIPLSFVYFKPNASSLSLILMSIGLMLPSFFLFPLNNPVPFIPIFILLTVFPIALKERILIWNSIINSINKAKGKLLNAKMDLLLTNEEFDFKFEWKISYREYFTPFSIIIGCAVLVTCIGLFKFSSLPIQPSVLFLIAFLFVSLLYAFGSIKEKNIALLYFSASYSFFAIFGHLPLIVDFGVLIVMYFFVLKKGFQNVIALFCFALFAALAFFSIQISYLFIPVSIHLILTRLKPNSKLLKFVSIAFTIMLVSSIRDLIFENLNASGGIFPFKYIFSEIFFGILFVSLLFRQLSRFMPLIVALLFPVLLVLLVNISPDSTIATTNQLKGKSENLSNAKLASKAISPIITFSTDRPVSYIETPVKMDAPVTERLGLATQVMGFYLQKCIIPYPMGFYYGYAFFKPSSVYSPASVLITVIFLLIFITSIYTFRNQQLLSFSLLFFLLSILTFSGIFYPVVGVAADRFAFLATFGWCVFLTNILLLIIIDRKAVLNTSPIPTSFIASFLGILLVYSGITFGRNRNWESSITLMGNDIAYLDESAQAHNLYATNLMRYSYEKQYEKQAANMRIEATKEFSKSVAIYPDFLNTWFDLGRSYMALGQIDSAYYCFEKTHRLDSTFSQATLNLARIAMQKNDTSKAVLLYKELIRIDNKALEGYNELSYYYFNSGQPMKSIETNKLALQFNPNWNDAYQNIARVYFSMGDSANAFFYVRQ